MSRCKSCGKEENMLGIYLAAIESEEDRATFAKIYTMYGEKMFKYALDLLKTSKEDAEDALHESFCRIIKALPVPDDPETKAVRNYLFITVHSVCSDMQRKGNVENFNTVCADDIEDLADSGDLPDDIVMKKMSYEDILARVRKLPEDLSKPFMLHYLSELAYGQIGVLLNISEAAARKRASRVKGIILDSIKKDGADVK